MKKLIVTLLLLSSTAMASFIVIDQGRYEDPRLHELKVESKDGRNTYSQVMIKFYGTQDELNDAWHNIDGIGSVYGFVDFEVKGYCRINTMRPDGWNDMGSLNTLGHELLHCFGAIHKGEKFHD